MHLLSILVYYTCISLDRLKLGMSTVNEVALVA